MTESIIDKIMPQKFGGKTRFRPREVRQILGSDSTPLDPDTLKKLADSGELRPIQTADGVYIYTKDAIEKYLQKKNS